MSLTREEAEMEGEQNNNTVRDNHDISPLEFIEHPQIQRNNLMVSNGIEVEMVEIIISHDEYERA